MTTGTFPEREPSSAGSRPRTLHALASDRTRALCRATDVAPEVVLSCIDEMSATWASRALVDGPPYPSDVSNDHTPFELSIAFGSGPPELRVMVEAFGDPPSPVANRKAGLALAAALEGRHADLSRLRAVQDIFLPEAPSGLFSQWYAAGFRQGRDPDFKAYLNPFVRGKSRREALVEQALRRLGFEHAWPTIADVVAARGPRLDEVVYFSVDLVASAQARVKVYLRHRDADVEDIERAVAVARGTTRGEAADFCRRMTLSQGPFDARPIITCLSFSDPADPRPASATVHVPVWTYAPNDRVSRDRIRGYLEARGFPPEPFDRVIEAHARRPLDAGVGMLVYASLRCDEDARVTVYLAPEAYQVFPPSAPRRSRRTPPPPPATELSHHFEDDTLADHPFFHRLAREPVSLERLWLVMANIREGVVRNFPWRAAQVVANVPDDRIRCLIAKQLDDELGEGNYARAHKVLFDKLVDGLAPWARAGRPEVLFAPGRALAPKLDALFASADPFEGLGALMIMEIFGKQVDRALGDEFRRQTEVPPPILEWLTLHETLELDHADDSLELARLLPDEDAVRSAWRGAEKTSAAGHAFFDGMYRLCFAS